MTNINWYPGHMTKSIRMMTQEAESADCCLYVLDARAPRSCINPDFEKLVANKPVIYILNKADLVPADKARKWVDALSGENRAALIMNCIKDSGNKLLTPVIMRLCKDKIEKYRSKGVKLSVKAMVMGVPNCGKSTLINNLARGAKTVTGNRAGVTRGKQWVRVGDYLEVMDTPGTLYPKLTDQVTARHLAYIGSIKDEVLDTTELALDFLSELRTIAPENIQIRYNTEFAETDLSTLEAIAAARGYLLKGREPDLLRAANALLDDFRKGKCGKIILEDC